jgi:TolB-like protein
MSPEQAAGDRALDARSDVYSLGCVVWEMIAGEPPFTGPTAQAVLMRRLTETPRPLRDVRETVPEGIERAVAKALAKSPADRFTSAGEFGKALREGARSVPATEPTRAVTPSAVPEGAPASSRAAHRSAHRFRVTAALAVGFLLGLGVLFGWLRSRGGSDDSAGNGTKRLAVLPFENLGRHEDDYFADGVTDEIRGKLAGLPGLDVTARSSSSQYKRTEKSPAEIGRELGVDYLLTGTVRWEKGVGGNRVRVSPELIRVATGSSRWQQPFDAALSDVFQVQADIAGRVAEALNLALEAPKQEQLAERPTTSLAAYDAFLKGEEAAQGIWGISPGELRNAAEHFEKAVALDSSFALAWAQLSRVLSYVYYIGTPTPADAGRAGSPAATTSATSPATTRGR